MESKSIMAVPKMLKQATFTIPTVESGFNFMDVCCALKSTVSLHLKSASDAMQRGYASTLKLIDPDEISMPRASTIFWSTLLFIAFIFFGGFAIGYPRPWMRIAVVMFNTMIFVLLAVLAGCDVLSQGKSP